MMNHLALLAAAVTGLAEPGVPGAEGGGESVLPAEQYWQAGSACGPNALYLLLRIHGRDVAYLDLLKHLSPGPSGSSLEELRAASSRWGLTTSVYQANRRSIDEIELPFIAHLRLHDAEHYVVVVGMDDEDVLLWDEEHGRTREMRNDKFFKSWTGYVLATGTGRGRTFAAYLAVPAMALLGLTAAAARGKRGARAICRTLPRPSLESRRDGGDSEGSHHEAP